MNASKIVREEPFGHLASDTKLERYWAQSSGLVSLRRQRTLRFDPHACATYAPTVYVSTPTQIRLDLPDDTWIKNSFKEFVRIEFLDRNTKLLPPSFTPQDIEEIEISDSLLYSLLKRVDLEVNDIIRQITAGKEAKSHQEMAQQIFQLLCHPKIGNKANENNVPSDEFIRQVASMIESQERLLFVLLGFPFKDQNRFRVNDTANQPDVGEIAFLLRLYRTTQAIYQVHPFGADILILTDGDIYQNIFGVLQSDVKDYAEKLKSYRSKLNLQGAVSFISLGELIQRASSETDDSRSFGGARGVILYIKDKLVELFSSDKFIKSTLDVLISAMKWNHESRFLLKDLCQEDAWSVLTETYEEVGNDLQDHWSTLNQKAISSAIDYAATNLMLRWLNLVQLYFPDSIRCTVHAKPGQISLTRINAMFPWNGIAWSKEWPNSIDDFEVKPYYSLSQLGPIRKVKIRTLGLPYFYTQAAYGSNIISARLVLPKTGWMLGDLYGRPFKQEDTEALSYLGVGDENFSWERLPRDAEYYQRLIKFRLDHYEHYGFGVHGLWVDGALAGQCGLQVLNETRDQVELVLFLGKAHVRKGIGLKLTKFILNQCQLNGIKLIYSVVRPENLAALNLLRRFNAKPVRTQVYFGYIATVFEISIKRI